MLLLWLVDTRIKQESLRPRTSPRKLPAQALMRVKKELNPLFTIENDVVQEKLHVVPKKCTFPEKITVSVLNS